MSGVVREVLLGPHGHGNDRGIRRRGAVPALGGNLVRPNGRVRPARGYKRPIALAGRDMGRNRAGRVVPG